MSPQFLIIGAQKSGTTRLKAYLGAFDDLYFAPQHARFFARDSQYRLGIEWYRSYFDACRPEQIAGAKQPAYHYLPWVPARIHTHLPQVKLIWIFREPVARTYSSYWHAASRGNEWLGFEKAIDREERRIGSDVYRGYVRRGLYAEQVERYLQFFANEQMLFLLFEEMIADPETVVNRTLEFLGSRSRAESPSREPKNGRRLPRSILLQYAARSIFGFRTRPYRLVNRLNHLIPKGGGYPPLDARLRVRLQERFRASNECLAALTGLDLDRWWPTRPDEASRTSAPMEARPAGTDYGDLRVAVAGAATTPTALCVDSSGQSSHAGG